MIRVAVMYPKTPDTTFDMDYYPTKHMPLVKERLSASGLTAVEVDEGLGGGAPGEPALYAVIGALTFETMDGFLSGMGTHGDEIRGDIPNLTNVSPTIQVSRIRT